MTRARRLRGSVDERVAALQEIAAEGSAALDEIELVLESLADERKAVQRRAAEAVAACVRDDAALIERLEHVLAAAPWRQRWGAAFALSLAGTVRLAMLPTLLEALDSNDGDVRWAAADLLKRLAAHDRTVLIAELVQAARTSTVNQRKMAFYILRDLQSPEGSQPALDGLAAAEIEVRLAALSALVAVTPDKADAASRVVPLLTDDDVRLRRAAAAALGQLGIATDAVRVALQAAAQTDDPALQRAANAAWARISDTGA